MNRQQILELLVQGKDQASDVLGKVGGSLSGLGGVASGIATGGLALAGAGIVALGAAAVGAGVMIFKFSQDTDTAMSKFAAQTGLASDELDDFKEVAKDVYAAGLGESIGDVVEQMALVHRGLGETGEELEASTRRAMILADAFEIDVGESIKWVSSMTKSWKIDSEEAFDIITKGMQMGLDVADDFGDTLHEYSGDFNKLGFTADQVLSMLNAGLEEGAYNTDVIADGWREYGIRLMEGGDQMTEVFDSMGLDFERMQGFIAAGDETWGEYAGTIVEGLMSIESEVERNAAGVAIFGTKWEDLGGEIFLASGQAIEGIEGIAGATDEAGEAMATGIIPALDRLKRKFITEFAPLGDKAGEAINKMIPHLEKAAAWLGEKVPLAIDWLEKKWDELTPYFETATEWLGENIPGTIDYLKGKWDELAPHFEKVGKWLGEKIPAAIGFLKEQWGTLIGHFDQGKSWFVENLPLIQGIFTATWIVISDILLAVKDVMIEEVWPALQEAFANIEEAMATLGIDWDDVWSAIGKAVKMVAIGIGALLIGLVAIVTGAITGISKAIGALTEWWKTSTEKTIGIVEGFAWWFGGISKFFKNILSGDFPEALEGWRAAWKGAWMMVKNIVGLIVAQITGPFNILLSFIGGFVDGFVSFFENLYNRLVGHSIVPDLIAGLGAIKDILLSIAGVLNGAFSLAFGNANRLFSGMDGALRRVSDMLTWMKDRIWDCINAFKNLKLPDWLTPGSPTPLEIGLVGIGKAFSALPITAPMGAAVAGVAAGGGGPGGIVHITNYFGRDSVRSDADIRRIVDDQQRMFELQGMRARIA